MKVFGIGLSKTGTTSLAAALEVLGYRTKDYPGLQAYRSGDLSCIDAHWLEHYEALTDTPIPSFYRELDRRYPGSKFILTVRAMEPWLLSCRKQFTERHAARQSAGHRQLFTELYGTAVFDEALFRQGHERFVAGVREHFRGRPQDLLELDVAAGQGWPELCAFLGRPLPELPFPKANVTRIQWMDPQALAEVARQAGEGLLEAHRRLAAAPDGALGDLFRKTVVTLGGGRAAAIERARAAASRALVRGLGRLAPGIPVVVRGGSDAAADPGARWNHCWLVDPIDGEAAFGAAGGLFSVNIALVEDQRPIAGVVHAPQADLSCFGMAGKQALVREGAAPARPLGAAAPAAWHAAGAASSVALGLCAQLDAPAGAAIPAGATMEWHTAAPHALARLAGRRLLRADDGRELAYGKPGWSNPGLRLDGPTAGTADGSPAGTADRPTAGTAARP